MKEKYTCHCGLYCENCATKARVEPAAKILYDEMKRAGFEDVVGMLPNGKEFWAFLRYMGENGTCGSCRDGGGIPGCAIRHCARERGIVMCADCGDYPCPNFAEMFAGYPVLGEDNDLLRREGMAAWARLQDERRTTGFAYSDMGQTGSPEE